MQLENKMISSLLTFFLISIQLLILLTCNLWACHNTLHDYIIKGKLGEFQIYFRKIPLHQQKFFVVSVLSNSPWLLFCIYCAMT